MSNTEVCSWVQKLSFGVKTEEIVQAFADLGVEGEDLPHIDDEALQSEFNVAAKIHRIKLLRCIEQRLATA